ncbi:MAG: TraR/DksA family transcriptional regulator [Bryobacteraceae bacterium]|nr:TraR/DksA family transcriptional regulator [Bryobacteraceae bacterium]MDW8377138.1 TraR/DksA family transcriptional regulator [Bryobacterales bacterium]
MTKSQIEKFKEALLAKLAELSQSSDRRDEIQIERAPDSLDDLQNMLQRDLAVAQLNRDARLIREIQRALARIEDGSYGVCLHCEEEISPRRLHAVPWAALCIKCQERADASQQETETVPGDEPFFESQAYFADAA